MLPENVISPLPKPAEGPPGPSPAGRWRRWRWRSIAAIVALAAVGGFLFRVTLLQLVARVLIVDEPLRPVQYALILERTCPVDEVARLYREGLFADVLLLQHPPLRVERLGIFPPKVEAIKRELMVRGIPDHHIAVLGIEPGADGDMLGQLQAWLEGRPEVETTAFVCRFESRLWQRRLDAALPASVRSRLHLHTFSPRAFDETNWWRSRVGVVTLFNGYLGYLYTVCHGDDTEAGPEWDPDAYLQELRQR